MHFLYKQEIKERQFRQTRKKRFSGGNRKKSNVFKIDIEWKSENVKESGK